MSDISKTTVNIPDNTKKELKKIAVDEEITLSDLIIEMIKESLENR